MPRAARWQQFHVEPLALLNDPDFVRMRELPDGTRHPLGERAQRAYVILWLSAWGEKEPGVIPYLPRRIADTVGLELAEWLEVATIVRPAIKVREGDGAWLFPKLIEEHEAQNRRYKTKKQQATRSANARWGKDKDAASMPSRDDVADATQTPSLTPSLTPSPSVEPNTLAHGSAASVPLFDSHPTANGHDKARHAAPPADPDDPTPEQWFLREFWPRYPRKVGRHEALQKFLAIVKKTAPSKHDELADQLMAGLERELATEWLGRPPDKLPHAKTWIGNFRWQEER